MSLALKSNSLATKSLGNVNGIMGDQDWNLFLDFENGRYIKNLNSNKTELAENEVLTCNSNKSLPSRPMTMDRFGNKSVITESNQLRWWQAQDRFGLLVEDSQTNFFLNSSAPATQTILNIPASSLMVASCIGPGSLIVSGEGITTTTVTENTPFAITPIGSVRSINIEVVGSLSHAQLIRAAGFATLHTPIHTSNANRVSGIDIVELNSELVSEVIDPTKPVTIVYQTLPLFEMLDPRPTYNESRIRIETNELMGAIGLTKTGTNLFNRLVSSYISDSSYQSSGSGVAQDLTSLDDGKTQAVQLLPTGAMMSMNGGSLYKPNTATGLNKITKISLGRGVVSPIHQGGNCIFTKLAIFNRLLTDQEITAVSKSWL